MEKKYLIFIFTWCVLLGSCKKSAPAPGATNNSGNGNLFASKNGTFTMAKLYNIYSGTLSYAGVNATACFVANTSQPAVFSYAGDVSANTITFKYDVSNKHYTDTTNTITNANPVTWKATGSGSIPAVNFTNNDSLPDYTGYANLPDTIVRSQDLNIQMNGISGASAFTVRIMNTSSANSPSIIILNPPTGGPVTLPASSLSNLPLGTTSLQVIVEKYNDQTISVSSFRFTTGKTFIKSVVIK